MKRAASAVGAMPDGISSQRVDGVKRNRATPKVTTCPHDRGHAYAGDMCYAKYMGWACTPQCSRRSSVDSSSGSCSDCAEQHVCRHQDRAFLDSRTYPRGRQDGPIMSARLCGESPRQATLRARRIPANARFCRHFYRACESACVPAGHTDAPTQSEIPLGISVVPCAYCPTGEGCQPPRMVHSGLGKKAAASTGLPTGTMICSKCRERTRRAKVAADKKRKAAAADDGQHKRTRSPAEDLLLPQQPDSGASLSATVAAQRQTIQRQQEGGRELLEVIAGLTERLAAVRAERAAHEDQAIAEGNLPQLGALQVAYDMLEEGPAQELTTQAEKVWGLFAECEADMDRLNDDTRRHGYNFSVPGEDLDVYQGTLMAVYVPNLRLLGYTGLPSEAPAKVQKIAKFFLAVQGRYFLGSVIGRGRHKAGSKPRTLHGLQDRFAWLVDFGSTDTLLRAFADVCVTEPSRTHRDKVEAAALAWVSTLPVTKDMEESILSWIDNFNALCFPQRFEQRWADDEAAPAGYVLPTEAEPVQCRCSIAGMCGPACACTKRLLECSANTCACPCTMLKTVFGGHTNSMGRWRQQREVGVDAMTSGRQEEIDSLFVFGKSGERKAVRNVNYITSTVGKLLPPADHRFTKAECTRRCTLQSMPDSETCAEGWRRPGGVQHRKERLEKYGTEILNLALDMSINTVRWQELYTVQAQLQSQSSWQQCFDAVKAQLLANLEDGAHRTTVDGMSLPLDMVQAKTLYALYSQDDEMGAGTPVGQPAIELAVRLEHTLRGDSSEVKRREERDALYMCAVADCWPAGHGDAPSSPQDSSKAILRGLRAMLKDGGSRSQPRTLRNAKEAVTRCWNQDWAARWDAIQNPEEEQPEEEDSASALFMKIMKLSTGSPGNWADILARVREIDGLAGLDGLPSPTDGYEYPWMRCQCAAATSAAACVCAVHKILELTEAQSDRGTVPKSRCATAFAATYAAPATRPPVDGDDATVEPDRLHFVVTDHAILQFVWDAMRDPKAFPRLFPSPATLHGIMFVGLETWTDRYGGLGELDSTASMMTVMNILSEKTRFLIEDPTANTRKMIDALTKYVWGVGVRIVRLLARRSTASATTVAMRALHAAGPEAMFEKASRLARASQRPEKHFNRLYLELEAIYDFLIILDFWEASHCGDHRRCVTAILDIAPLLWSTPNSSGALRLAHPLKAEEHLGHVIALASASERVYNIITRQCLFTVFRGDGVQRDAPPMREGRPVRTVNTDEGQEFTNNIIKDGKRTMSPEMLVRTSACANASDVVLQDYRRHRPPRVVTAGAREVADFGDSFKACVYGMARHLEERSASDPNDELLPGTSRARFSHVVGRQMMQMSLRSRRTHCRHKTQHVSHQGADGGRRTRSLKALRAATRLRAAMTPLRGSAAHWAAGGYDDRRLRDREGGAGDETVSTTHWVVPARKALRDLRRNPHRDSQFWGALQSAQPTAVSALHAYAQTVIRTRGRSRSQVAQAAAGVPGGEANADWEEEQQQQQRS